MILWITEMVLNFIKRKIDLNNTLQKALSATTTRVEWNYSCRKLACNHQPSQYDNDASNDANLPHD